MQFPLRPKAASNFAYDYDLLFFALTALTVFFTVVVGAMVLFFALRYRKGTKADRSKPMHENVKLELLFLIVPTILGLAMFGWGTVLFVNKRTFPENAMEIFVVGKQWMWHAQHMNGVRENNELHLPLGQPVKLTMISQDVVHGFFIPQFRVQYHVVPGRYTQMWFIPTRTGRFNLFCSVHCGTQHSEMAGYVYVLPPDEFARWLASGGNRFREEPATMAEAGEQTFREMRCGSCHGATDTQRGPSLYGMYGNPVTLETGQTVIADAKYIRSSILTPWAQLTAGYGATMPAYKGTLNEERTFELIAYIKTLGQAGARSAAPEPAPALRGTGAAGGRAPSPANPNGSRTPQ
jgi:cytochrome c oxidase subunit 2